MPWSCVRGARGRFGGIGAGAGCCVFPVSPFLPRVSCAVCGGPSRPGVPYPRSLVRHSMRSVRSAGAVRLPSWFSPRVLSRRPRHSPLPRLVWRAHLARSRCWALVGPFHAVRAPPRVLPRLPCCVWLVWKGGGPFPFPPYLAWGCAFGRGASGVRRSPTPNSPSVGACGRGPLPTGCGFGGCGRGDPSPPHSARSCKLALRALGAARGRPGRAPLAWVWGVRGRALCHPRPPVLSGVRSGPTTHWLPVRGVWAWGPVTNPTARALACWLCALWGRHEGARGGAPLAWVWGVRGQALSYPRPPVLPGRAAGAHYPPAVGAGGAGVGTRHQPHSARSCVLALRAAGAARGRLGGALLAWVWGSGVGRSPTPDRPSFGACGRGPLPTGLGHRGCGRGDPSPTPQRALLRAGSARCGGGTNAPGGGRLLPGCEASGVGRYPGPDRQSFRACCRGPLPTGCRCGGCGRGDPSPTPQRALLRAGCVCCGGGTRAPRGGRLLPGCGLSGFGRSPGPDCPSFRASGRGPLPAGCGCGGCGRGDPSPTPQRVLLRAGFAPCGGGTRAPGGGASCLSVGRPGSGALPPPTARLLGRASGAHYPLALGAGGAGLGTRHRPHSARPCVLALCAVGAAQGRPGGAPLACVRGVRGRALSHPRLPVLFGVRLGPTTHWLWVRGLRVWGPVTNPTARALASWLCALWGRQEGARGGRLLPGCGASGVGRSPTPDHPSFRACGRGTLPTGCGCGGRGRGDPSPPHSARSCELALRAVGAARGRLGGALLAWVWGVRGRALSHPRPPVLPGVRPGPATHWLWVRGVWACGPSLCFPLLFAEPRLRCA